MDDNNNIKKAPNIPPFLRYCSAIIPTAFDDSLSYYEALCALYKFIQRQIVTTINNNATVTQSFINKEIELEQLFKDLKDYVDNYFANLDVQEEINNKLDAMVEDGTLASIIEPYLDQFISDTNEKLDTLPVEDESKTLLGCFFSDDDNKFTFYQSDDGITLKKITLSENPSLTGADPSLMYKNGKYYLAYTHQSETYDFSIKVSEDLNTWTEHDINAGLYNATYTKRWAPEWFEDSDGKLYIIISVQYADTEGWGDFRPWIIECTDLENMTFGTPRRMYLNDSPADNHIDATVCKQNGVYRMIVKSDHQTELYLEYFTSTNLVDWNYVSADPVRMGRRIEAPDIIEFNGKYYIYAENYTSRQFAKGNYYLSTTSDFVNFTNPVNVCYPDMDLSHGGFCVIPKKAFNKLLTNGNITVEEETLNVSNNFCEETFYPIASQLTDDNTNTGNRLGNYLHVFDVVSGSQYRTYNVQFHITTATSRKIDATYNLTCVLEGSGITSLRLTETDCATDYASSGCSLAGHMIAFKDATDSSKASVYIDLQTAPLNSNEAVNINFISEQNWFGKVIKYRDDFANSLDLTSGKSTWANGSENSRTTLFDMGQRTKARIKFACRNSSIDVFGNVNGTGTDRILNGKILVNGGYVAYKNFNDSLISAGKAITVTLENYDSAKTEYQILFENIPNNTSLGVTIPPTDRSYIKSTEKLS